MKTAFVTGATGFVGSHTARLLLERGWRVRALVRRPDRPGLLPAGVEVVTGDLLDAAACRTGMNGCDAVLHIAGVVKARTLAEYMAGNATGAEAVARTAAEVCPHAMFVLVSSQAAAGPAKHGRPVTEADEPQPVSWYGQSKLEGEKRVEKQLRGPWCIVRPGVVYGAGDPGVLELFRAVQSGFALLPAGGRTRVQVIAVQDLAWVLASAVDRPDLTGRRGFAAAEAVSIRELIGFIANLRRPPARMISVPAAAVRLAGLWESLRQRVTRKPRPFNRDKAREMLQPDWLCDARPLLKDLQIDNLQPWQEGIAQTCRCYVEAGWLRTNIWAV